MPAFENHDQKNGVYMTELLRKIKQDRRIENILMDVNTGMLCNLAGFLWKTTIEIMSAGLL